MLAEEGENLKGDVARRGGALYQKCGRAAPTTGDIAPSARCGWTPAAPRPARLAKSRPKYLRRQTGTRGLVLGPSPNSLQNEADLPLGCRMVVTSRESEIMERSIGWTLPAKIGAPRFPQKSTGAWEV